MTVRVEFRPEFQQAVEDLCEGLTNEQVSKRTNISAEYVRKMRKLGQVPSREIVESLANGFKDKGDHLEHLLIAAGYKKLSKAVPAIKLCLESVDDIPDQGKQEILMFVKETKARYDPTPG